jgi:UDP-N-acetylmuramate--alanine ligase
MRQRWRHGGFIGFRTGNQLRSPFFLEAGVKCDDPGYFFCYDGLMSNILKQAQKIHFIGIGGIGISAIARMLLLEGKIVSGSDRDETKVTEELRKAGAIIFIGAKKENIPVDCDLIIYTVAIPIDNSELMEANARGLKILTYPETLNIISKEKYTIAVSGTHGKTTVTAMVAKIMIDAGLDPTVIVGSLIKFPEVSPQGAKRGEVSPQETFESNFIMGKSKYLVVEADEYKKSFHNLEPSILVINNLDEDHLDFYKDLADIQDSFLHLALKLPVDGFLICNKKLPNLKPIIEGAKCQVVDYSEILLNNKLLVPGEHNRQNAKAAAAVGQALDVDKNKIELALSQFVGTWRRFEYKGKTEGGALIYDDYAHNPQKVRAALQGARELYPDKKIIVVFQPHLFSRTKLLLKEFATAFTDADEVILTPIFAAREVFDPTISSEILAEEIKKVQKSSFPLNGVPNRSKDVSVLSFPDFESIVSYLKTSLKPNDIVITMGAGEQYKIGDSLL